MRYFCRKNLEQRSRIGKQSPTRILWEMLHLFPLQGERDMIVQMSRHLGDARHSPMDLLQGNKDMTVQIHRRREDRSTTAQMSRPPEGLQGRQQMMSPIHKDQDMTALTIPLLEEPSLGIPMFCLREAGELRALTAHLPGGRGAARQLMLEVGAQDPRDGRRMAQSSCLMGLRLVRTFAK